MVWEPLGTDALCVPLSSSPSAYVRLGKTCGVTKSLLDSIVPEASFSRHSQSEFANSLHPPVLSTLSIHAVKFRPQASYSLGHAVVQPHSTNSLDVTAAVFRPARASSACAVVIADTAFHVTPPFTAEVALTGPVVTADTAFYDTASTFTAPRLNVTALPFTPLARPCGALVGEGGRCSSEHRRTLR